MIFWSCYFKANNKTLLLIVTTPIFILSYNALNWNSFLYIAFHVIFTLTRSTSITFPLNIFQDRLTPDLHYFHAFHVKIAFLCRVSLPEKTRISCNIGMKKEIGTMQDFLGKLDKKSTISRCNFKINKKILFQNSTFCTPFFKIFETMISPISCWVFLLLQSAVANVLITLNGHFSDPSLSRIMASLSINK